MNNRSIFKLYLAPGAFPSAFFMW